MKIEAIPVNPNESLTSDRTQVVRLKVTGPVDPHNEIVRRARELVIGTGSEQMLKSFDRALERGRLLSTE